MVNEPALNTFPAHDVEGTIAHEVQHIIFKDPKASNTAARVAGGSAAHCTWSKLKEVRADIFAALHKIRYADGLYEGFLRYGEELDAPAHEYATHPSVAQRIRIFGLIRLQLDELAKQPQKPRPVIFKKPGLFFAKIFGVGAILWLMATGLLSA